MRLDLSLFVAYRICIYRASVEPGCSNGHSHSLMVRIKWNRLPLVLLNSQRSYGELIALLGSISTLCLPLAGHIRPCPKFETTLYRPIPILEWDQSNWRVNQSLNRLTLFTLK